MKRRRRGFRGLESDHARRSREAAAKASDFASKGSCGLALGHLSQAEYWRGRAEAAGESPKRNATTLDEVRRCFLRKR